MHVWGTKKAVNFFRSNTEVLDLTEVQASAVVSAVSSTSWMASLLLSNLALFDSLAK